MSSTKKYKCPYCNERLIRKNLITHIDKQHSELIPQGYTAARVVYNQVNKIDHGKCRVCSKPTAWSEKTGRYEVLCGNPKCKEYMREEYKKNMLRARGTYNILNDPEQQKKMLANRKISGTYRFSDGGTLTYTGTYEKKCLEFMDVVMQIPSKDILSPGPTIEYEYNGEKHFYITDFYYIPYNIIIEVKDGGDNLNTKDSPSMRASREKTIEKERIITDRGEYNYIRLTNNNFSQLIEIFMNIKQKLLEGDDSKTVKINEGYFDKPSFRYINDKTITLYHGTDIPNLDTIIPNSYNMGIKHAKPKMSSFWFKDPNYAATFATMTLIYNNDTTLLLLLDDDMKLLVCNKYKSEVMDIIKNNKAYVYEKTIDSYYVGYGHEGVFPEYTLDIPVKPDHYYEINADQMIGSIKFVSEEYIQKVKDKYKKSGLDYNANAFQKFLNKIFYYDNTKDRNAKLKKAKKFNESSITENTSDGKIYLSQFSRIRITQSVLDYYKNRNIEKYKNLNNLRLSNNTEGYFWTDSRDEIVAILMVEYKSNGQIWIRALEVNKEYQNRGLYEQVLKYATDILHARYLCIDKNNKAAIQMCEQAGFKIYDETDDVYFMNKNIFNSTINENTVHNKKIFNNTKFLSDKSVVYEAAYSRVTINTYNTGFVAPVIKYFILYMKNKYRSDVNTVNIKFINSVTAFNNLKKQIQYPDFKNAFSIRERDTIYIISRSFFDDIYSEYDAVLYYNISHVILSKYEDKPNNIDTIDAICICESNILEESPNDLTEKQRRNAMKIKEILETRGTSYVVKCLINGIKIL